MSWAGTGLEKKKEVAATELNFKVRNEATTEHFVNISPHIQSETSDYQILIKQRQLSNRTSCIHVTWSSVPYDKPSNGRP